MRFYDEKIRQRILDELRGLLDKCNSDIPPVEYVSDKDIAARKRRDILVACIDWLESLKVPELEGPPSEPTICANCEHGYASGCIYWCNAHNKRKINFITGELKYDHSDARIICENKNKDGKCPDYEQARD